MSPYLDCICCGAHKKQGIKGCVNDLVQSENHLDASHQKGHQALALSGRHRRFRVCDHEKNKQLIHGPCNGRHTGRVGLACPNTSKQRKD